MASDSPDLNRIALQTLAHYGARADDFWAGTRDHDVSQNYEAFLRAIEGPPPFTILDFGCGPGRDLTHFKSLGQSRFVADESLKFRSQRIGQNARKSIGRTQAT